MFFLSCEYFWYVCEVCVCVWVEVNVNIVVFGIADYLCRNAPFLRFNKLLKPVM